MMPPIVDSHFHLWQLDRFHYPWLDDPGAEGLGQDYLPSDLRHDIDGLGVIGTVHIQAEVDHSVDPAEETAWLASMGDQPGSSIPTVCVGYADLRRADVADVLDRHEQHRIFRGIRQEAWYDPQSQRADVPRFNLLDDPSWARGLRELDRRGLSFDLLVWSRQLEQAAAIFRELPGLRVAVNHVGVPAGPTEEDLSEWRQRLKLFAEQVPSSTLKISGLIFVTPTWEDDTVAHIVRDAIDVFGPERCMFGSNFPVERLAIGYGELWSALDRLTADLSDSERHAMFHGNANAFYRMGGQE
ncbi:amidohydrolase family protein [Agromyces bauzanensis]